MPLGDAPTAARGRFGRSLGIPAFRRLFGSSLTSTLGAAISLVSVNWLVYHYTHSAIDITLLGLTGIGPGIALGLVAGVTADRYNRRSLMVTADLARMAGMGALTAAFLLVGFSLPLTLGAMLLVNSFSAVFTPASQAIVPRLVPTESLADANGFLQSASSVAYSLGSAAGGLVVVGFGAVWGLGINALTYALSAMFLIQIAAEFGRIERGTASERPGFRAQLSEGLRYVIDQRPLLVTSFGYFPSNFLSACVFPFFVIYAGARFGADATIYGYLAAAVAAGTAVGAVLVGRLTSGRHAGVLMGILLVAEGACYVVLSLSHVLGLSLLAAAGDGLTIGFTNTLYYSTIQAIVPGEMVGRVASVADFGSFASIPAGLVAGGLLISRFGVGSVYLMAGVGIVITGAVLLSLRDFRSFGLGRPPPAPGAYSLI